MKFPALLFAAALFATSVTSAPVVLLASPVRVIADVSSTSTANTTKLDISVQHDSNEFILQVLQRGQPPAALLAQKAVSGWKDGYLFIRDDCLGEEPATAWRCVVDHVFTLVDDTKDNSRTRLIYVGDVFAGEECIEATRIGCALYKGVFADIYDRLEGNALAAHAESPALLIESTVQGGIFAVDLEETWKANQERYLAGVKCLQAKPEAQPARCTDGITPRRAYLFNAALTTYTRQEEQLARTRMYARAALCESGRERLSDAECSDTLRASALMLAGIKPGEMPRARGKVSSPAAKLNAKP
jgi:hypothetical protein